MDNVDIIVLDPSFERIGVVDDYESEMWIERYSEAGEFEICTRPTELNLRYLSPNNYLARSDSDFIMVIEQRQIEDDPEEGLKMIVKGRSLESILDRRIIWNQKTENINTNLFLGYFNGDDRTVFYRNREKNENGTYTYTDAYEPEPEDPSKEYMCFYVDRRTIDDKISNIYFLLTNLCYYYSSDETKYVQMTFNSVHPAVIHPADHSIVSAYFYNGDFYTDALHAAENKIDRKKNVLYFDKTDLEDNIPSTDLFSLRLYTYRRDLYNTKSGENNMAGYMLASYDISSYAKMILNDSFGPYEESDYYDPQGSPPTDNRAEYNQLKNRTVPNFRYLESASSLHKYLISQPGVQGDNAYELLVAALKETKCGYRIKLTRVFPQEKSYTEQVYIDSYIYRGKNSGAIFSEVFDNLAESRFTETFGEYKNVLLCSGVGEGRKHKYVIINAETSAYNSLGRRETFLDGTSVKDQKNNGNTMSPQIYLNILYSFALAKFKDQQPTQEFDFKIDNDVNFKYGTDEYSAYYLGDIVTVDTSYGIRRHARVTEYVRCHDRNGYSTYPTLEVVDESEVEQ